MQFVQCAPTESVVRGFSISSDGQYLIAAGQQSGNLVSYRIAEDGRLKKASTVFVGGTPWWVTNFPSIVEPNGQAAPSDRKEFQ